MVDQADTQRRKAIYMYVRLLRGNLRAAIYNAREAARLCREADAELFHLKNIESELLRRDEQVGRILNFHNHSRTAGESQSD